MKQLAKEKLKKELESAKNSTFADPVIRHLMERIEESDALAADICQDNKSWGKCMDYITAQARKTLNGSNGYISDPVVYEWAEDYFHEDDKDEGVQAAKTATLEKPNSQSRIKSADEKMNNKPEKEPCSTRKTAETSGDSADARKPRKKRVKIENTSDEIEGQLDIFSFIEM